MPEQQLNLFSAAGIPVEQALPQRLARLPAVVDLGDEALIAAIPAANLADCTDLAAEAARRRLAAAIPALAALCRILPVLVLIAWSRNNLQLCGHSP